MADFALPVTSAVYCKSIKCDIVFVPEVAYFILLPVFNNKVNGQQSY